jgi:hypothetical protein
MIQFNIGDRVSIKMYIFHQLGFSGRRNVVTVTELEGNIVTFDKPILYDWLKIHVANIELVKRKK